MKPSRADGQDGDWSTRYTIGQTLSTTYTLRDQFPLYIINVYGKYELMVKKREHQMTVYVGSTSRGSVYGPIWPLYMQIY